MAKKAKKAKKQTPEPIKINCEKCQDKGFTEKNAGLFMVLCDCEAGKKKREELGLPDPLSRMAESPEPEKAKEIIEAPNDKPTEVVDDKPTNEGTGSDDKPTGSPDTSEPRKSSKRKARRKAAKKSS